MYLGIPALSFYRNCALPRLSDDAEENSPLRGMGCRDHSSPVATDPSNTSSLVDTFCARTKQPQSEHGAHLAYSPLVSGAFTFGMARLEMAAAGYFWVDCSGLLFPASLLF